MPGPFAAINVSIAQLADALDIPPYDALDALAAAGVATFWHEGHKYGSFEELKEFLADFNWFDAVREVEVDLNASQVEWFAKNWDLTLPSGAFGQDEQTDLPKPLRKFVASDAELPEVSKLDQIRSRG